MLIFHLSKDFIISIHAPTRGATDFNILLCADKQFQSTLPQGERLGRHLPSIHSKIFQSTLPQGERRPRHVVRSSKVEHFNPRSHKGSDLQGGLITYYILHFNPRSHKGSDCPFPAVFTLRTYFNPRSHKGSDPLPFFFRSHASSISIHAPTRGATKESRTAYRHHTISIHAPTRGATKGCKVIYLGDSFPSTFPKRARPIFLPCCDRFRDFNPRSHKGSDGIIYAKLPNIGISIHAPTRGATAILL